MNHTDLGWGEIERLTDCLAAHLPTCAGGAEGAVAFDRVIGVARGGLIPAALLATRLEVKCVETIQVCLYEGSRRLEAPQLTGAQPAAAGPNGDARRTVVVDEILDSGTTMALLRGIYPEACFAVLLGRHAAERGRASGGLIAYPARSDVEGRDGAGGSRAGADRAAGSIWVAEGVSSEAWVIFPWSPAEDRPEGL